MQTELHAFNEEYVTNFMKVEQHVLRVVITESYLYDFIKVSDISISYHYILGLKNMKRLSY